MKSTKKPAPKPELVFALLCYRGVTYAKWVNTSSLPQVSWKIR